MKLKEAIDAMQAQEQEGQSYIVTFEWREQWVRRGDHFPDVHSGEPGLELEEANALAERFERVMGTRVTNVRVMRRFTPVSLVDQKSAPGTFRSPTGMR